MSTSLRQLTNRIEDLYIDSPSGQDVPTPPSRRIKSVGTPYSPPSSPVASSSRTPSTPSPAANTTSSASTLTSPLLRLSTTFPTEIAVKERDTPVDEDTITYHTSAPFSNAVRLSRASSYNPKQWRTSSFHRVEGVDQFATLRNPIEDHLYQRGYISGVCSDISINAFGKSYALHRIILDRSPFFSSLFAGPWRDSDIPVLNLDFSDPNITQPAFDIALQRLYGHVAVPDEDVASLLATGAYLDLQDLVEECLSTLLRTLNPQNVSKQYEFARGKQYYGEASEKLAEACYTLLCHAGSSMSLDQWDGISNEVAAEVISSDAFWVDGEYERYCFARDFIKRRRSQGSEDVHLLEQVLMTGIHYLHLPFETLQLVLSDTTEDGKPFVPPGVIHHALWQQTNLRQIIISADPTNPSLNLAADDGWSVPSKDTMTDPFNADEDAEIVPVVPEKMGSDLTSPVQETEEITTTASPYPPFRFSVEFRGIRALTEGEKVYSRTVFYAGSHWRLYVQKKRSKRPYLGFYLQRRDHKILPHLSRDASIHRLMGTFNGEDIFSAAATGLEYESAILYNATARGSRKSLYKHRQSNSEPEDECKRTSIAKHGLGYVDERAKVLTYFKLWCSPGSATSSGVGMRQYNSKPDTFNLSQSWGWKSNTLCMDEKKESNEEEDESKDVIRFTVALGNV